MKESEKMVALCQIKEAIKDWEFDWWNASDLFETAANAATVLMITNFKCNDDKVIVEDLLNQHVMFARLLKDIEGMIKKTEDETDVQK